MLDRMRTGNPNWWIPWSFFGFFAVMFVANGTMLYYAVTTWTGVETNNAYRRGLEYNKKLEAAAQQRALGWSAAVDVEPRPALAAQITLTLADAEARPLSGAEVAVTFVRPTHEGSDFAAQMPAVGSGRYRLDAAFPLPGQWDVRLDITHPSGTYAMKERIFVRP